MGWEEEGALGISSDSDFQLEDTGDVDTYTPDYYAGSDYEGPGVSIEEEDSGFNWGGLWDTVVDGAKSLWDSEYLWAGLAGVGSLFGGDDESGMGGKKLVAGGGGGGGRAPADFGGWQNAPQVSALSIGDTKGRTVGHV